MNHFDVYERKLFNQVSDQWQAASDKISHFQNEVLTIDSAEVDMSYDIQEVLQDILFLLLIASYF